MRTITNFFLANLAFADFCVGIFCVYQNLSLYLSSDWEFGDFMCKMYHFINGLSYTTSVAILVVICVERYLAIVHPLRSKRILTLRRLKIAVVLVWILSATYCSPRIVMYGTVNVPGMNNKTISICILKRRLYDSKIYDLIQFMVLFVLPLCLISVMYLKISLILWNSVIPQDNNFAPSTLPKRKARTECELLKLSKKKSDCASYVQETELCSTAGSFTGNSNRTSNKSQLSDVKACGNGDSKNEQVEDPRNVQTDKAPTFRRVLRARRKVIQLLVIVVMSFALCNLPFHARKLWTHWSPTSNPASNDEILLTPITFVIMYLNSGINPILYAFFSDNFRKCMIDVLIICYLWFKHKISLCCFRKN
ncbi:GPRNPR2 (predicted) [Pycnogonum litorale]